MTRLSIFYPRDEEGILVPKFVVTLAARAVHAPWSGVAE